MACKAPDAGAFNPEDFRAFALKARTADPAHGRALFTDLKGLACIKCHTEDTSWLIPHLPPALPLIDPAAAPATRAATTTAPAPNTWPVWAATARLKPKRSRFSSNSCHTSVTPGLCIPNT